MNDSEKYKQEIVPVGMCLSRSHSGWINLMMDAASKNFSLNTSSKFVEARQTINVARHSATVTNC